MKWELVWVCVFACVYLCVCVSVCVCVCVNDMLNNWFYITSVRYSWRHLLEDLLLCYFPLLFKTRSTRNSQWIQSLGTLFYLFFISSFFVVVYLYFIYYKKTHTKKEKKIDSFSIVTKAYQENLFDWFKSFISFYENMLDFFNFF